MALFNALRKLTGIIKGAKNLEAPRNFDQFASESTKELKEELPEGDRVAKKRNWIAAKGGK